MKKIELLAPVGNQDSLKAAVSSGADAVYLGAKTFSARESANNFTIDELIKIINYCHLHDVRVYTAVNTLLRDKEIEEATELIKPLYNAGVDSIIIQDFGAATVIKEMFPGLPIHASTQLGVHNVSGEKWAEQFGFSRAILSRETNIESIKAIRENTDIELEAFVHGALCSSFSGQCLFSSFIGRRSGNRGRCAQPCRMFYELYDKSGKVNSGYLLSTKEMCTIGILKDMMEAGISSFKIEGRARRSEYVSLAVRSYRKAIDDILEGKDIKENILIDDLMRMYNRGGFTTGYYYGNRDITAIERPNNWGVFVGTVEKTDNRKIYIKSKYELSIGDGLEFVGRDSKGSCAIRNISVKNGLYEIDAIKDVVAGDKVYRNTDSKLLKKERENIKHEKRITLKAEFSAKIGEFAMLTVTDDKGNKAIVNSLQKVQESLKEFDMQKQSVKSIAKTGGTGFEFGDIKIIVEKNSWMPISEISSMRRQCLEMITQQRLSDMMLYEPQPIKAIKPIKNKAKSKDKIIIVQTGNIDNIKAAINNGVSKIFYAPENFNDTTFKKIKDFGEFGEIYIKIPIYLLNNDETAIRELFSKYSDVFKGAVISHITQLKLAKEYFKNIIGGAELNVFNSSSLKYLNENSVDECILSPELNIPQAAAISGEDKYIISHGKLTLMNLPHCPVYESRKCNCNGLSDVWLKDRKGYELPLKRSKVVNCNIRVLNGVEFSALPVIDKLNETDINGYVIIDEDYEEARLSELVKAYKKAIEGTISKNEIELFSKETTRGHLNKGVL